MSGNRAQILFRGDDPTLLRHRRHLWLAMRLSPDEAVQPAALAGYTRGAYLHLAVDRDLRRGIRIGDEIEAALRHLEDLLNS